MKWNNFRVWSFSKTCMLMIIIQSGSGIYTLKSSILAHIITSIKWWLNNLEYVYEQTILPITFHNLRMSLALQVLQSFVCLPQGLVYNTCSKVSNSRLSSCTMYKPLSTSWRAFGIFPADHPKATIQNFKFFFPEYTTVIRAKNLYLRNTMPIEEVVLCTFF